jgi:hypothetical protein
MKQEIKEKWIATLRSGKYKQGAGHLRNNDLYCCLGVLCDIYAKENQLNWEKDTKNATYKLLTSYAILPVEVYRWAETKGQNPIIGESNLADLNDIGKTFKEIADLIEIHL